MAWSEETMEALNRWIRTETWHVRHPDDDGRFYDFVRAYWLGQQDFWDEDEAENIILSVVLAKHPHFSREVAEDVIDKRRAQGSLILSFLNHLKEKNDR